MPSTASGAVGRSQLSSARPCPRGTDIHGQERLLSSARLAARHASAPQSLAGLRATGVAGSMLFSLCDYVACDPRRYHQVRDYNRSRGNRFPLETEMQRRLGGCTEYFETKCHSMSPPDNRLTRQIEKRDSRVRPGARPPSDSRISKSRQPNRSGLPAIFTHQTISDRDDLIIYGTTCSYHQISSSRSPSCPTGMVHPDRHERTILGTESPWSETDFVNRRLPQVRDCLFVISRHNLWVVAVPSRISVVQGNPLRRDYLGELSWAIENLTNYPSVHDREIV